ncbi:hypothetical protein EDC62_1019 [Tibeticola sediminis]|uniref:Methyl-accepting chemotaxis protein n=1 Tax=Tibeticola sediminis TaxID=1917811 RepID=A0A3N4V0G7_9BURK|nr:chemotaxis protein [Tibeticola sediminis]RPE70537.1 hypothetical protein EDC62_1019 [Tibeticola sediminis]
MNLNAFDEQRRRFVSVADATFAFQGQLQRRLREIDRKALNAQVLVKRHGKDLAGYGVVAQSFREGAQQLQAVAHEVQQAIHPLMLGFMETLRASQRLTLLERLPENVRAAAPRLGLLASMRHEQMASHDEQSRRSASRLHQALGRFEAVVAELEYVVVNGRIEAALKGSAQAALQQVSMDMDKAVIQVRELLRAYREQIDRAVH